MKAFKSTVSILLCLVMILGTSIIGAYAQDTAALNIAVISGTFSMKIDSGKNKFMGSDYRNAYADVGSTYTVTAEPDGDFDFLYWKNSNGKILSTDEQYTFVLGADMNITAVYNRDYSGSGYVTFLTDSNQELSRQLYSSSVSADKITVAKIPSKVGYVFIGWSVDGVNPIADGEIQAEIKSALANGNVNVTPIYEKDFSQQFDVNVTNAEGSGSYYLLSLATATAQESVDSVPFSYWQNVDGEIVSFEREYSFAVTGDETLTAVYSSENIDKQIVNRIDGAFSDSDSITFVSYRSIKGELTLVQSGIIITNSPTVGTSEASFVVGGSGVLKGTSSNTDNSGSYMLTKANASGTWYARPYVIYQNDSGALVTDYGDVVSVTVS